MLDDFFDFLALQPFFFLGLAAFHFGLLLVIVKLYLSKRRPSLPILLSYFAQFINGVLIMLCAAMIAINLMTVISNTVITVPGEHSTRVIFAKLSTIANASVLPAQLSWITIEIMFIRTLRPRSHPMPESERSASDPDRATSVGPANP